MGQKIVTKSPPPFSHQKTTMSNIKLVYADFRGRAEPIRLCFKASGKPFEDYRFKGENFNAEKEKSPNKKLPYMVVDGKEIAQSGAIALFAAKHCGMCGSNLMEETQVMSIFAETVDLLEAMVKAFFEKDEAKKAELYKTLKGETIPKGLKYLEDNVQKSGFFVGSALTLADVAVYDFLDSVLKHGLKIDDFPGLKALRANVDANAGIKKYLSERPKEDA